MIIFFCIFQKNLKVYQMKKLTVALFAFFMASISAQNNTLTGNFTSEKLMQDLWFRDVFEIKFEDVQGSPYHTKDFVASKINGPEDVVFTRYNKLHDNVEFIQNDKIVLLPKDAVYGEIHVMNSGEILRLVNDGYYFVVYESPNNKIYKKSKVKFQNLQKARNGYEDDRPARFIPVDDVYYIQRESKMVEIPKSTKDFSKIFPEKSSEIQDFIKKNKLKLNSDQSFRQVMNFINGK